MPELRSKWIEVRRISETVSAWRCPHCTAEFYMVDEEETPMDYDWNYCPTCGKLVIEGGENEEKS